MSFQNGPQPLGHRGPPRHNFTIVEQVTLSQVSKTGRKVLNLQYFTVVACSTVFFLCFATSKFLKVPPSGHATLCFELGCDGI